MIKQEKGMLEHLPKSAEAIRKKTEDLTVPMLVANIAGAFPVMGPLVANPILTFITEKRFRELEHFLVSLCEQLSVFESLLNAEHQAFTETDEYAHHIINIIAGYLKEKNRLKKEAFIKLGANSILNAGANIGLEEDYLNMLNDMSSYEFLILNWFASGAFIGWDNREPEGERERRRAIVSRAGYNIADFSIAISRLESKGFFEHPGIGGPSGFRYNLDVFQGKLNDVGKGFMDYILNLRAPTLGEQ